MKGTSTSLSVVVALLLGCPSFAFTQLGPDPSAPPQSNIPSPAQGAAPAPTPAVDSQPDLPPPGPPPPASLQNLIPADQLSFLNGFANQPTKALLNDKRFRSLMKEAIPHTEYHYGSDMSLYDAAETVLGGTSLPIVIRDGRFVAVSGNNAPYLSGHSLLWFDLETGVALGAFYFHPTNGEPSPTVTVFSRQLVDQELFMSQLPEPFVEDLERWAVHSRIPEITPRYFIPENGKKYVLIHDEDYCWHEPGERPPDPEACQQMNASAADDDMNAAYFMKETENAANATAWMLGPDQIAWISIRDRSCGSGLACRIRITRQRTQVLTGHPPAPRGRR